MVEQKDVKEIKKHIDVNTGKLVIESFSKTYHTQESIPAAIKYVREEIKKNEDNIKQSQETLELQKKDLQDLLEIEEKAKNWLQGQKAKK